MKRITLVLPLLLLLSACQQEVLEPATAKPIEIFNPKFRTAELPELSGQATYDLQEQFAPVREAFPHTERKYETWQAADAAGKQLIDSYEDPKLRMIAEQNVAVGMLEHYLLTTRRQKSERLPRISYYLGLLVKHNSRQVDLIAVGLQAVREDWPAEAWEAARQQALERARRGYEAYQPLVEEMEDYFKQHPETQMSDLPPVQQGVFRQRQVRFEIYRNALRDLENM